ncbi:MAG: hypothetical protein E7667_01790 [Ruminococcaceae bacterium]|nr:hypothetical protein [Oscillospiraceae bacterium]
MKRRKPLKFRMLAAFVAAVMLININVLPLSAVFAADNDVVSTGAASANMSEDQNARPPTSVDDIKIPTVSENPYDIEIRHKNYPVFNDDGFDFFRGDEKGGWIMSYDLLTSYGTHFSQPEGASPYYTAALTPMFSYEVYEGATVKSQLPYREGRTDMLHSELTLTNGTIETGFYSLDSFFQQINSQYAINKDQVFVRVGATLLSGQGRIYVNATTSYSEYGKVSDGEAKEFWVDVPLNEVHEWTQIWFEAYEPSNAYQSDAIMTDFFITLVDNTNPTVTGMTVEKQMRDEQNADLVINMKFNEGIRITSDRAYDLLDDIWLSLELLDLNTGERSTVRMYLEKLNDDGTLTFRGDIGLYHYKNFRVSRITKFNIPSENQWPTRGMVDLADEFYVSAYDKVDYGNDIIEIDTIDNLRQHRFNTTVLSDYASNPINTASVVNWQFGNQVYISNTFETTELRLYTEQTLRKTQLAAEGEKTEAELTDQFIGPSRTLIVYAYLDQTLTDEEASKVWLELNILHPDGTPVKAYATSWSQYKIDELYTNGSTTATLLKFENIKFTEGMMPEIAEGEEPVVKVARLGDDIEDKTAYPNVKDSVTDIYADFTGPEVTLRKYAAYSNTESDGAEATSTNYKVSIAIGIKDVENYTRYANLIGSKMFVELGGGVSKDTSFRYILTDNPTAPEAVEGYTSIGTISKDGKWSVGSTTLLNNYTEMYLHVLFETNDIYLDELYVNVIAEDSVGNKAVEVPTDMLDYKIDEIAPEIRYEYRYAKAVDNNTNIEVYIGASATDSSDIVQILYSWGENPDQIITDLPDSVISQNAEWQTAVFDRGTDITVELMRKFGDGTPDSDKIYYETLYIKAVDEYGNESEPVAISISVSLQKPATNMRFEGNMNAVSRDHRVIVTVPDASMFDNSDAYTRVAVTPSGSEYSYVTLVKTGETANILSFKGLTWYKVIRQGNIYTYVSAPEFVGEDYEIHENSIMYDLFTYYGDIKVSFENGYGDMVPVQGAQLSSTASMGSYMEDQNYLLLRFASPYDTDRVIHGVDFGAIIDRDDNTVVINADKGSDPYKFNAVLKGVNPMRNTQIHFTVSNIAKHDFKLLDFDWAGSYAELYRVGENGEADVLVERQDGLAATASQYFTIGSFTDDGEFFVTGAYYLKVTVKSNGGHYNTYESSRLVLDAQTADNAGVWQYSTQGYTTLDSIREETYIWQRKQAENAPFENIGVAVSTGGEVMRSRVFAVYSYGVTGLSLILEAPGEQKTYEGLTVGAIEGFRLWNILSNPTDEEINAQGFYKDSTGEYKSYVEGLSDIYTEETIPKGENGFNTLYFVKGVNTFCYQIKLENGYVSPIRQFTVVVSDYVPELNIAIENYQPSHKISQKDGVVNASYIRFLVETAYSLNGTGKVDVDVWTDYGMNVGIYNESTNSYSEVFAPDPSPNYLGVLGTLELPDGHRLKVGDYVDFTQNSYTSQFPKYNNRCTATFVARDEYGAITIVAPQIGDQKRIGNLDGDYDDDGNILAYTNELNIDYYGSYFDDPFTVGDSWTAWRKAYNQPQYFGAQLLGFNTHLRHNTEEGEYDYELLESADGDLMYNLFNIVTNDIQWASSNIVSRPVDSTVSINYFNGNNFELIRWQDATVTFSGGDLKDEVTLALGGEENTVGYMGASIWKHENRNALSLRIAFPKADEEHPAGTKITRNYKISSYNIYGKHFETEGTVDLYYIDYSTSVSMKPYGAEVYFSFGTAEYGTSMRTGIFNAGDYTVEVTDNYGNRYTILYKVDADFDPGTAISYSEYNDTPDAVTVTISRPGSQVYVDITNYAIMSVENNGTDTVKVTLTDNTNFSYRYLDSDGAERMFILTVDNIKKPNVRPVWNYNLEDVNKKDDGTKYRYGEVTVYLTDPNFSLIDKYSGKIPSFTFTPDGEKSYTFRAQDIEARLGDKTVAIEHDITVALDIELYPTPDPLGLNVEDKETPNVQVLAYANRGGYYFESKLALQLENARHSTALVDYKNYKVFEFVGARANASELIKYVGWSTSYRFEIETVDMSRVRLFIKEGLYASPPDYETGISDVIEGVELNSKLLTVTKNAKFTLFVVDSKNNASSIAFDVNNLGEAPIPEIVKVTVSNDEIRGYIIPPEDVLDFEIIGTMGVKTDLDTSSDYFGYSYIEYTSNDNYTVSYTLEYNGVKVNGSIDVSITEINLREISIVDNGIVWSANKASEATPHNITATVALTEEVKEIKIVGEYDEDVLSFYISGNQVILTYKENHPEVEFRCYAENGSSVTVRLDAVENIDRSAPEIKVVSKELAANGKSLILTLSSNERAIFKEGGYFGEAITDENGNTLYYYTRKITANGIYSYTFSDVSGIMTTVEVEITEIVTDELEVQYSTSIDGNDPQSDPSTLDLMIGDKVYLNPNRDATVEMSGGDTVMIKKGEWNEITIPDAFGGLLPYFVITDEYGNALTHQFSMIEVPDTTAPDIVVAKKIYSIRVGADREQIERELLANFAAYDDDGGEVTLSVKFTENIDMIGVTEVEYIATDSAGNSASVKEKLRITSIYEPEVYYGEQKLSRGDGLIVSADSAPDLVVNCNGVAYAVKIKSGIRTEAQMKDGITVTDYTKEENISLGQLEKGIYTICIITQERDYFKILISVE